MNKLVFAALMMMCSLVFSDQPIVEHVSYEVTEDKAFVIKIRGLEFGAKYLKADNSIAPLFEDDFDGEDQDEPVGSVIVDGISQWEDRGEEPEKSTDYQQRAVYTDEVRYSHSDNDRSMRLRLKRDDLGKVEPKMSVSDLDFAATDKILVSFWMNFKWPSTTSQEAYQYKIFVLNSDIPAGSAGKVPTFSLFGWYWPETASKSAYTKLMYRNTFGEINDEGVYPSNSYYFPVDALSLDQQYWYHYIFMMDQGDPGMENAQFLGMISDPVKEDAYSTVGGIGANKPYVKVRSDGLDDPSFGAVGFPWYLKIQDESWDVTVDFDDIVVDNSWAQVWLGDGPTFDSSRQLELQSINEWSDDETDDYQIGVKFNLGGLKSYDSVYLYVMNEDGEMNEDGYKLDSILSEMKLKM